MSTHAMSNQCNSTAVQRPAIDILVERAARSMLAWSERRVEKNIVSHERMQLLIENQRAIAGGSSVAR